MLTADAAPEVRGVRSWARRTVADDNSDRCRLDMVLARIRRDEPDREPAPINNHFIKVSAAAPAPKDIPEREACVALQSTAPGATAQLSSRRDDVDRGMAPLLLWHQPLGIGGFFEFARPPLLPEDARYMSSTTEEMFNAVPGLVPWPTRVFGVMGGYVATTKLFVLYVANTGLRSGSALRSLYWR